MNQVPITELQNRRNNLIKLLEPSTAVIIFGNEVTYRNSDIENPFRQDSNFWYFVGFDEPNATYILSKNENDKIEEQLLIRDSDKKREIWTGPRYSKEQTKKITTIENITTNKNLKQILEKTLKKNKNVYYDFDENFRQKDKQTLKKLTTEKNVLKNINLLTSKLRVIKSDWEVKTLRKSCKIASIAHQKARDYSRIQKNFNKDVFEYQLQAEIERVFGENGTKWSYYPIIASGKNACTLHYAKNNQKIRNNDLVLIDAGCELNYYGSDITRTFCHGKEPTKAQQIIYDIVLKANKKAIKKARTGNTLIDIHKSAVIEIVRGLKGIGILKKTLEKELEEGTYKQFFMHSTSHFLGLDTHDVGEYKDEAGNATSLKPGMVITIEPGLYFNPNYYTTKVAKEFRNIGVRIEDNILITEKGCEVLTKDCPK